MDTSFINTLIAHGREDPALEWKQEVDVRTKRGQAEFIRDMLSLVNAHGEGPRYLLIGVANDGEVVGVPERTDDATFQQVVNSRVNPPMTFTTTYVIVGTKEVGVIEVAQSPCRPHLVSQDLFENSTQHLREGETCIKKGSSKGPLDAWDHQRLREEAARQSTPQPRIEVVFEGGGSEFWPQVEWEPTGAAADFPVFGVVLGADDPPGVGCVPFEVVNEGMCGAEHVTAFVRLPEGCKVYERDDWVQLGGTPTGISGDSDGNSFTVRVDRLTHGLRTPALPGWVVFLAPGRRYTLTWSAHAANMLEPVTGELVVHVAELPGSAPIGDE